MSFDCCFVEILGHCTRTSEAAANELIHNVDGWQLHFDISHYDGWDDVHSTDPGISVNTAQSVVISWLSLTALVLHLFASVL